MAFGEPAGAAARDSQVVLAVLEATVRGRRNRSVRAGERGGGQRGSGQYQDAGSGKTPHEKGSSRAAEQGDFLPNQW